MAGVNWVTGRHCTQQVHAWDVLATMTLPRCRSTAIPSDVLLRPEIRSLRTSL